MNMQAAFMVNLNIHWACTQHNYNFIVNKDIITDNFHFLSFVVIRLFEVHFMRIEARF